MTQEMRKSGIDVLGDIPWGTHFCHFYQTKKDFVELLTAYFKAGLENNEYCLWVISNPLNVEKVMHSLRQSMQDFEGHLNRKSFEIMPITEGYLKEGKFNPREIINGWIRKLRHALDKGFDGMRIHGNKGWLEDDDWESFQEYEEEFARDVRNHRMIMLCTYPLAKSDASTFLEVVHTHGHVIATRQGDLEVLQDVAIGQMEGELRKKNLELSARVEQRTEELEKTIRKSEKEIAERKRAETQLFLEKELSNEILDSIPGLVGLFDENMRFVRWNKIFEKESGYTREEIPFLHGVESFFDNERDKSVTRRILKGMFEKGFGSAEVSPLMKDGTVKTLFFNGRRIIYEGKICLLCIGVDISERKNAEETLQQSYKQIRALTNHLQNIREEERIHIAREIHDELGQKLTVMKMDAAWLNKNLNKGNAARQKLQDLTALLDSTIQTVRRISTELRPSLLDDLGLAAAMEWHLKEFEKRSSIRTHFNRPNVELPLNDQAKIAIFRIFQESLTNVARHSNAREVKIGLVQNEGQIVLSIQDNGKSFDKQKATDGKTLGILDMKERAESLGWNFEIQSDLERGTTVLVKIPVTEEQ
jgi:PAS domain S-box-containing protein